MFSDVSPYSMIGIAFEARDIDILDKCDISVYIDSENDMNIERYEGLSPLQYACFLGSIDIVRWLLNIPGIMDKIEEEGEKAFEIACEQQNEAIKSCLLEFPNIYKKNKKNSTHLETTTKVLLFTESFFCNETISDGYERQSLDYEGRQRKRLKC